MKIIAIMNQKGGVGKTTVTVNFAAGLARLGRKVLVIDADLQANTTAAFGVEPHVKNEVVCDLLSVLINHCNFNEAIITRKIEAKKKTTELFIIPASIALSGFDQAVRALPHKQLLLKQLLFEVKTDYDYILIDCPPSLGLMTINALVAAHEVLVPVQPEFFALQGISQLLETVTLLQKNLNHTLKIGGVLCTRFNRRKIHQEVLSYLEERFKDVLFKTKIHENIAIAEAPSFGKTIFEYSNKSNGAYDFDLMVREFLNKEIRQMSLPIMENKSQCIQK